MNIFLFLSCFSLGALWVCIVLNPHCTATERVHWKTYLEKWAAMHVCPLEDADFRPMRGNNNNRRPLMDDSSSDSSDEENGKFLTLNPFRISASYMQQL